MIIGVNLLPFRAQLAGAGRYAQNVIRQLARLDEPNTYVCFVSPCAAPHFQTESECVRQIICPVASENIAARIFWEQCFLPLQLVRAHVELLFTPSVAIPLAWRGRKATVIYDAIPFHPEIKKYLPWRHRYVRWMTRYAAQHSNVVITDSNFSRRDLAQHCQISENKIVVAPSAVSGEFHPVRDADCLTRIRMKYQLPAHFILFVGTIEPGKNLLKLVQAFRELKRKRSELPQHLILAGARGWDAHAFETEIARQSADDIHLLGFVAEEDLPALYSAAELFVFPSLYEGFGLPLLEAMACGTPAIASDVSAMPEVAGDAAMLFSPYDATELASAMERALCDSATREKLIQSGLIRSHDFSWERTASIVLRAFDHA